ncbi:MAG TPA: Glu/Leu/Phe/Val dehydrogenase dimerization domain-containing protein [Candidatus Limnocylindria bacterium]|nr:Glu/Leu/Phe/Val dehydrogenase dimerization domain-containing protein [Candidatus Limnocylindria bacterium]
MPGAANPGDELLQSTLARLDPAAEALNLDRYRVQQSTERDPGKGGIPFHPSVALEEVQGLAMSPATSN